MTRAIPQSGHSIGSVEYRASNLLDDGSANEIVFIYSFQSICARGFMSFKLN